MNLPATQILCPLCKTEGTPCGTKGPAVYYHFCGDCETVWLFDRSLYLKACKEIYDTAYVSKMNSPDGIRGYRRLVEQYFNLLHYIAKADELKKTGPLHFLEIGFSLPSVMTYFFKQGYDVTALDIKIDPCLRGNLEPLVKTGRLSFIESDFETWQTDREYNVLWMSHVLEHFEDTMAALFKVRDLLKNTGVAFISSPDAGIFIEQGVEGLMGHMHPEEHLFMFSLNTFREICEQCGLRICFTERYGDPIPNHFEFITKMEWRAVLMPMEKGS